MLPTTPGPVWVMVTETYCQGVILGEWEAGDDGGDYPVFHATEGAARRALAEWMRDQWQEVFDGNMEDATDYYVCSGYWDGETFSLDSDAVAEEPEQWTLDEMRQHSGRGVQL